MICPNCGSPIETAGKFCPHCGAQLQQTAPPPASAETAPPSPDQLPPVATPLAPPPAWSQTPPPPPPAGQWGPAYAPPGAYYAPPPAAAASGSAGRTYGLLALIGGAVAVGSAWLPWMTYGGQWSAGIDATSSELGLANGDYLIGAGVLAALCGVLLAVGAAQGSGQMLLGFGAIAGAIGICVVEAAAFMKMSDMVSLFNSFGANEAGFAAAIGWGIFVGAGGGLLAGLGGLLTLSVKRAA